MRLRGLVTEDFVNYKLPSMFLITSFCDFKCCKEAGNYICQNLPVLKQPIIEVDEDYLLRGYLSNPITKAIVFGGLEPMLQFEEVYNFIDRLRWYYGCSDPVVIYTGFYPEEIRGYLDDLSKLGNIIIKFGRYIPDDTSHFDPILGVNLASNNQWAEEIQKGMTWQERK